MFGLFKPASKATVTTSINGVKKSYTMGVITNLIGIIILIPTLGALKTVKNLLCFVYGGHNVFLSKRSIR